MRARLPAPLFVILGLVAAPGLRAQAGCDPAFAPAADSVRQMVSDLGLRGAGLIIRVHGRPVCEVYVGPLGAETEIPVVSAAKWLSAAAILSLVDEGTLRLDDSVSQYLPYFKGDKRGITVRQLLSHTSGLPDYAPCMFQSELSLDDCARQIGEKTRLRAAPGREFAYGGAAFSVAGRVAEVAEKASWAEIFAARIAAPLGLRHTGYGPTSNPMLSEGLTYSSATDYATFLQMLLDGGIHDGRRVLSEATVEEMMRDQTGGITNRVSPRGGVLAAYDRIERVWPTALAVMTAARDGAVALDSAGAATK